MEKADEREVNKMALKALLLKKKLSDKRAMLEELRKKDEEFSKREQELTSAIDEAESDEDKAAVEEEANKFDAEKQEHEDAKASLEQEVEGLETELKETEAADEEAQRAAKELAQRAKETKVQTREAIKMNERARKFFGKMDHTEREAIMTRDDVKNWLNSMRQCVREKRAVTNAGLTVPEVFMGLLRENVMRYSKLLKHVNLRTISGNGRMAVQGTISEAIWTECCAILNEATLSFYDVEVDCYKVGAYFAVCNANIEDSDIDLAATLLDAIAQGIGLALDKAILYGQNTSANMKMPKGIVSRLLETEEPTGYPATARPWADLHTSNVKSHAATVTGIDLFKAIVLDTGAMKSDYSRGEKVFVMNETTYTKLQAEGLEINAAGAIVSAMNGSMPGVGGVVEVLNFVPDNIIIGGYFDCYLLTERGGAKFAESEHVRFINDQTVFKGTARYDGQPVIPEAFIVIAIGGATPASTMTFAADTANAGA